MLAKNTRGYKNLSEQNKNLYKKFLYNFINVWGLETRATIKPLNIKLIKTVKGHYLRFDYEIYGDKRWLHVTGPKTWY